MNYTRSRGQLQINIPGKTNIQQTIKMGTLVQLTCSILRWNPGPGLALMQVMVAMVSGSL